VAELADALDSKSRNSIFQLLYFFLSKSMNALLYEAYKAIGCFAPNGNEWH
jgi:hypothetical protein